MQATLRGIPACSGCHSPTGAGIPAQYPAYRRSACRVHAGTTHQFPRRQAWWCDQGRSQQQRQVMASIAAKLTDAEVKALSEYTAGLKAN